MWIILIKSYSRNHTTYTLVSWPLILWYLDHLYSGIWDILSDIGHGKRTTLSSGIRTIYPLGFVLWESTIWELRYNHAVCMYSKQIPYTVYVIYFVVCKYNVRPKRIAYVHWICLWYTYKASPFSWQRSLDDSV